MKRLLVACFPEESKNQSGLMASLLEGCLEGRDPSVSPAANKQLKLEVLTNGGPMDEIQQKFRLKCFLPKM